LFDEQKTGFVEFHHLKTILKVCGRDPSEADDLLKDLSSVTDKMNFRDFLVILNTLENRIRGGA